MCRSQERALFSKGRHQIRDLQLHENAETKNSLDVSRQQAIIPREHRECQTPQNERTPNPISKSEIGMPIPKGLNSDLLVANIAISTFSEATSRINRKS